MKQKQKKTRTGKKSGRGRVGREFIVYREKKVYYIRGSIMQEPVMTNERCYPGKRCFLRVLQGINKRR